MTGPLTPELYERACEVADQAARLTADERQAFLEDSCADDAVLRAQVERLLSGMEQVAKQPFLDKTGPLKMGTATGEIADPLVGKQLGAYLVQQRIAVGGMGCVYRAQRIDDYRQLVAIKVTQHGGRPEQMIRRFAAERQHLAKLHHPHIATLLDGGTTPDGRPYFVLEYVDGYSLTRFAERHNLGTRARLQLFQAAAAAVQYAHEKGFLHRDLKPDNILVTSAGQVKLLDFGIAKVIHGDEFDAQAAHTRTADRALTPAYASPEQFLGAEVTAASDVYSLGVILFELLAGRPPYRLTGLSPAEAEQLICAVQPPRPSDVVLRSWQWNDADGADATVSPPIAGRTDANDPQRLARALRGDLDTIVGQALRKEPERRYATVAALSLDIDRYLNALPVQARGDSWHYRAYKFLARNPWSVAFAAAVSLAVVAGLLSASTALAFLGMACGIVGLTIGLTRARQAQRLAERRFADVRDMATSLLFDIDEGLRNTPGTTSLRRYVMEQALEKLGRLEQEAAGNAGLIAELTQGYFRVACILGKPNEASCGLHDEAIAAAERSGRLARQLLAIDAENLEYLRALAAAEQLIVEISDVVGRGAHVLPRQEAIVRRLAALTTNRAMHEGLRASYVSGLQLLGKIYVEQGKVADAATTLDVARTVAAELVQLDPLQVEYRRLQCTTLQSHACVLRLQGKSAHALAVIVEAIRIRDAAGTALSATLGDHQGSIRDLMLAASLQRDLGELDSAEASLNEAIRKQRDWLEHDPQNRDVRFGLAAALYEMTQILTALERRADTRDYLAEALCILEPAAGSESLAVVALFASLWGELSDFELAREDLPAADSAAERQVEYATRFVMLNPEHHDHRQLIHGATRWAMLSRLRAAPVEVQQARWERASRIVNALPAGTHAAAVAVAFAEFHAQRAVALCNLGEPDEALVSARAAMQNCPEFGHANPLTAIGIYTGAVSVACEVAFRAIEDRALRLHEARAYCQAGIAMLESSFERDSAPEAVRVFTEQVLAEWRSRCAIIEQELTSTTSST